MNWLNWWVPLLALFGLGIVAPVWLYFVDSQLSGMPIHVKFFASLMLPALGVLFVSSWLDPG